MRIAESARKHGITDDAMLHAVRMARRIVRQENGIDIYLGADHSVTMLEVGVADIDGDDPRIVHAMRMRAKFEKYL